MSAAYARCAAAESATSAAFLNDMVTVPFGAPAARPSESPGTARKMRRGRQPKRKPLRPRHPSAPPAARPSVRRAGIRARETSRRAAFPSLPAQWRVARVAVVVSPSTPTLHPRGEKVDSRCGFADARPHETSDPPLAYRCGGSTGLSPVSRLTHDSPSSPTLLPQGEGRFEAQRADAHCTKVAKHPDGCRSRCLRITPPAARAS
jgi:hypothetical protein